MNAQLAAVNGNRLATHDAVDFWHTALLSLNLGFAVAYGMLSYLTAPLSRGEWLDIQIATQVRSVLHLQSGSVALEVWFLATLSIVVLVVSALIMLSRLAGFLSWYRMLAYPSGVFVLGAAPASWLYAIRTASRYIFWWSEYPTWPRGSPWLSLGLEVSLTFTLVCCLGKKRIRLLFSLLPLAAHYLYWAWFMWPGLSHGFTFSAPRLCSLVCPASGVAWLRYLRQHR